MVEPPKTPMLDKEHEAREAGHSQQIGDFLEWLESQKILLAQYDTKQDACRNCSHPDEHRDKRRGSYHNYCSFEGDEGESWCDCDWSDFGNPNRLFPTNRKRYDLLAEYFGIDTKQAEEERQQILGYMRKLNKAGRNSRQ